APAPASQPVKLAVRSTPAGALVFRGRERLGQTPLDLDRPSADTDLRFELTGHEPLVRRVTPSDSEVEVTLVKRHGQRQSHDGRSNPDQPVDQAEDLKASPF